MELESLSRFEAFGLRESFLRHAEISMRLDFEPNPLADSQVMIVPGLADSEAVPIQSYNFIGFYLRHQNKRKSQSTEKKPHPQPLSEKGE